MANGSWAIPPLTSASFCTGIGGWEVATEVVGGYDHKFFSEIEPFPCAVLAHHWPEVANFGDMTAMDCTWWRGKIDVVWGSCPCQAFSFSGRRRGLKDKRGALTLAFVERVEEIEPTYVLYENVKGILSDRANAFGCLLGALAGEDGPLEPPGGKWAHAGYVLGPKRAIAWRLFDAQHGGVPQRRERVFVVGSSRDGADPRDILFEQESCRRDLAPRRRPGRAASASAAGRRGEGGQDHPIAFADVAAGITASIGEQASQEFNKPGLLIGYAIAPGDPGGPPTAKSADVAASLTAKSEANRNGRGTHIVQAYSLMPQNSGKDYKARGVEVLQPLLAAASAAGDQGGDVIVEALGVALRGRDAGSQIELGGEIANTLRGADGHGSRALALIIEWAEVIQARVRRLTPLECERLQGLPDNHTRIRWGKRHVLNCPDGPRYKAIGNGLAIPDVRWLARRVQHFHGLKLRELEQAA